jgi:hypothetical protein
VRCLGPRPERCLRIGGGLPSGICGDDESHGGDGIPISVHGGNRRARSERQPPVESREERVSCGRATHES